MLKDLSVLSDEELIRYLHEVEDKEEQMNLFQLAAKILINALYGALAEQNFRYYDIALAEAITLSGQMMNKYITRVCNAHLNQRMNRDEDFIPLGDTDSVVGSTVLRLNTGLQTIESLWNETEGHINYLNDGTEIKSTQNISSLTTDGINLEYKNVPYIMRHKVTKRMFRIRINDTFVDVTEDHSIMVERDGILMGCKPEDIKSTDMLMYVRNVE